MIYLTHRKIKYLIFSILFFLGLYIIAFLYAIDLGDIYNKVKNIPLHIYLILILISLVNYLTRFARWLYFVLPLKSNISIIQHLLIYLSGFALTTTPGKSGEMIRSVLLASFKIKYSQSLAAFISERFLDVIAVAILATILSTYYFPKYQLWMLFGVLFLFIIFFIFRSDFLEMIIQKSIKHQSKHSLMLFQKSVKNNLSNKSLKVVLPLSFFAWGIQSISLVVLVNTLGFSANIFLVMGIYNISILAGALSFIPGGVGATEAAISYLLYQLGMDLSLAIVASILVRGLTLWFAVFMGILSMLIYNIKHFVIKDLKNV